MLNWMKSLLTQYCFICSHTYTYTHTFSISLPLISPPRSINKVISALYIPRSPFPYMKKAYFIPFWNRGNPSLLPFLHLKIEGCNKKFNGGATLLNLNRRGSKDVLWVYNVNSLFPIRIFPLYLWFVVFYVLKSTTAVFCCQIKRIRCFYSFGKCFLP